MSNDLVTTNSKPCMILRQTTASFVGAAAPWVNAPMVPEQSRVRFLVPEREVALPRNNVENQSRDEPHPEQRRRMNRGECYFVVRLERLS